jgi:dihydroorotase
VMVHIGSGPPTIGDVLALLQPGDILTHCFTGQNMRIVDEKGRLLDEAKRALDMGVMLDVGHGVGGLAFASAEAVMTAGYRSHVISSDLHQSSILGPVYDLPTCLSKFMALGMSFAEVIDAATTRPAAILDLADGTGTLRVGGAADVALFTVEEGRFPLYDASVESVEASHLIRNTVTVVRGQILPRLPDPPPAPWMELSQAQRSLVERGHTPDALTRSDTAQEKA